MPISKKAKKSMQSSFMSHYEIGNAASNRDSDATKKEEANKMKQRVELMN